MTTILVTHDSRPRRRAIRSLLEGYGTWTVVDASAAELEEELRERPEVVVVEIAEGSGIDAAGLEGLVRRVPVVCVTSKVDDSRIVGAWDRGATLVPADEMEIGLAGAVQRAVERAWGGDPLAEHVVDSRRRYELPNDALRVPAVADELVQLARPWIADPVVRYRLRTALVGLIESALYDGNLEVAAALAADPKADPHEIAVRRAGRQPYVGRRIHVEARIGPARTVFEVEHEGPAFDLAAVDGGRLVETLGRMVDEVRFESGRTVFTLVRKNPRPKRPTSPAAEPGASVPPTPAATPDEPIVEETTLDDFVPAASRREPSTESQRRRTLADELVGDAITATDVDPEIAIAEFEVVDEDSSPPKGERRRKKSARIDRDVTDLLSNAPEVDAFGDPVDDEDDGWDRDPPTNEDAP